MKTTTSLAFRALCIAALFLQFAGCAGTDQAVVSTPTPSIIELELESHVFDNTRTIRVLLPPGYHAKENEDRDYPVFYFTDGLAAFDAPAWNVPGVVTKLWEQENIQDFIFVGIDNGCSTQESTNPLVDRASEYLPYPDPTWTTSPLPEPKGQQFPAFLFDEVMPLVEGAVRAKTGREHTGLAGSSYGGAIALYTALNRPDRIGYLLLESPSLHVGSGRLFQDTQAATRWPLRIYLGTGTQEGDTPEIQQMAVENVRRLYDILSQQVPADDLHLIVAEGATHWYDAWRARLLGALAFLIAP